VKDILKKKKGITLLAHIELSGLAFAVIIRFLASLFKTSPQATFTFDLSIVTAFPTAATTFFGLVSCFDISSAFLFSYRLLSNG
jgi:hypothetical protein